MKLDLMKRILIGYILKVIKHNFELTVKIISLALLILSLVLIITSIIYLKQTAVIFIIIFNVFVSAHYRFKLNNKKDSYLFLAFSVLHTIILL